MIALWLALGVLGGAAEEPAQLQAQEGGAGRRKQEQRKAPIARAAVRHPERRKSDEIEQPASRPTLPALPTYDVAAVAAAAARDTAAQIDRMEAANKLGALFDAPPETWVELPPDPRLVEIERRRREADELLLLLS